MAGGKRCTTRRWSRPRRTAPLSAEDHQQVFTELAAMIPNDGNAMGARRPGETSQPNATHPIDSRDVSTPAAVRRRRPPRGPE